MKDDERDEGPFDIDAATISQDDGALDAMPIDGALPFDVSRFDSTGRRARKLARRSLRRRRERRGGWSARQRRR